MLCPTNFTKSSRGCNFALRSLRPRSTMLVGSIRSHLVKNTDRREFLQLLGMGAMASSLGSSIAQALEIPANNRTRSIRDVEHTIFLIRENGPLDHPSG